MNDVIGIAWYKDEATYRRALAIFTDPKNMPATYEDWQALVGRERKEIKGTGNIALRVDIDPETFKDWCNAHGFLPDSQGRMAFVNHVELAYEKTGKGTIIEQLMEFAYPESGTIRLGDRDAVEMLTCDGSNKAQPNQSLEPIGGKGARLWLSFSLGSDGQSKESLNIILKINA